MNRLEDDQGGAKKRLLAGEAVFHGTVQSMDAVTRSASIECQDMKKQSGKAVTASNRLVRSSMAGIGDTVAFFMKWSRDGPQASPPMLRIRAESDFALRGKFRTGTAGYGFVNCDLMTEFFGRDAHVERELADTFETGQTVCFNVCINAQGMPTVSEMSTCRPDWHPTASDVAAEIDVEEALDDCDASTWLESAGDEGDECDEGGEVEGEESQSWWSKNWSDWSNSSTSNPRNVTNQWSRWNETDETWTWKQDGWKEHPHKASKSRLPKGIFNLGQRAEGVIKSFNEGNNYGFIESKEVADVYGRDTFIHGAQFKGHSIGERVRFTVHLGRHGQPQATNVSKINAWPKRPASDSLAQVEKRRKAGDPFFLGVVTSYFPEKTCGFIDCAEVRQRYQQEVYVFEDVLAQSLAGPGDLVAFYLHFSKQKNAQASHPMLRLKRGVEGTFALKGRFNAGAFGVAEIHCPEILSFFGCAVKVDAMLASVLEAGSLVAFNITVEQGIPVAFDAEPCEEDWVPPASQLTLETNSNCGIRCGYEAWGATECGKGKGGNGGKGGKGKGHDNARHPRLQNAGDTAVLIGQVKSFDESKNYGFIACDLVSSVFGRDTVLHGDFFHSNGLSVGDKVLFEISFTKDRPQAQKVQRCVD
eukprot:symbB.v1.2.026473.t1/scaffold2649.1/size74057/5